MENNKRMSVIWLLVVIIILLVVAVGLLLVKTINENGTKVMEETNTANNILLKEEIKNEVVDNVENKVENNNAQENKEVEVKTEIREVEKYVFAKYDSSKSDVKLTETFVRLGAPLDSANISENGTVSVRIIRDNNSKNVSVTNLSAKVVDVIGGPLGDGANSIMYLLMEDGTVEYTEELWSATTANNKKLDDITEIKSIGKVEGLSNIVRICYLNNNMAGVPIAIDKDGNSHSLAGVKVYMRGLNL